MIILEKFLDIMREIAIVTLLALLAVTGLIYLLVRDRKKRGGFYA